MTATVEDLEKDRKWDTRNTLNGYHFYVEDHPERATVDQKNAEELISYVKGSRNKAYAFHALNNCDEAAAGSTSDFGSFRNKLFMANGAPIILTKNINFCFHYCFVLYTICIPPII